MLYRKAVEYGKDLSEHEILEKYWGELTLVLKGSIARGNSDQYSDIDFVFYCDKDVYDKIINEYFNKGLTKRRDGVFMPLPEWIGHYNFETFDTLDRYFIDKEYAQIWEYSNVILIHDPDDRYKNALDSHLNNSNLYSLELLKNRYLELQLTLDWLRHPLKRGDKVAVLIHCSKLVKDLCQLCYLLDKKPYPHDKWLFPYLKETKLGNIINDTVLYYSENILNRSDLKKDRELHHYPQYYNTEKMLKMLSDYIIEHFGTQSWIEEWYLYV